MVVKADGTIRVITSKKDRTIFIPEAAKSPRAERARGNEFMAIAPRFYSRSPLALCAARVTFAFHGDKLHAALAKGRERERKK